LRAPPLRNGFRMGNAVMNVSGIRLQHGARPGGAAKPAGIMTIEVRGRGPAPDFDIEAVPVGQPV